VQDIIQLVNKGRVVNLLPDFYMESRSCHEICSILDEKLPYDIKIVIRNWETPNTCNEKHIVIITSAEAHTYIPPEIYEDRCIAGFMHYYPKTFAYDPSESALIKINKLYPLPLGSMRTFNAPPYVPIKDRKYDFCFIGQLDPYRRMDFYNAVCSLRGNNYIHFYKGWNNGFSADHYAEVLSQSKIALVPCGSASLDTFRFYEAAECGCVILSCEQNRYEFMNNFYADTTAFFCEDWKEAIKEIYYKYSMEVSQEASENTRKAWENHLSPRASANYILRKLGYE